MHHEIEGVIVALEQILLSGSERKLIVRDRGRAVLLDPETALGIHRVEMILAEI